MNRWGGKKITKEQREEILQTYLQNPEAGCNLAMSHGLSQIYAYKLAHERGLTPQKRWPGASESNGSHPGDLIIDRSPAQKEMRIAKIREELRIAGYSIVSTKWLLSLTARRERSLEAAE